MWKGAEKPQPLPSKPTPVTWDARKAGVGGHLCHVELSFPWGAKLARQEPLGLGCCVFCLWWGLAAQGWPRGVLAVPVAQAAHWCLSHCCQGHKLSCGWVGQEISTGCQDHLLEPEQWHEVELGLPVLKGRGRHRTGGLEGLLGV